MYKVRLQNFEGPLDLLLFLIKKNEVDIYDIPISEITKQYLEYIELMQMLDLEIAGEFILMAATLMEIKVMMLLPRPQLESEEEEFDPREELVRRLLEYKRFKEIAEKMYYIEEEQRKVFPRIYFDYLSDEKKDAKEYELIKNVTLFDLISAFKNAIDNMPKPSYHKVKKIEVTLEQQMAYITNYLKERKKFLFGEILKEMNERIYAVVTFMAVLDMIKNGRIIVRQNEQFGDIWIYDANEFVSVSEFIEENN